MSDADTAAPNGCSKTDTCAVSRFANATLARNGIWQTPSGLTSRGISSGWVAQVCIEGASISAIARIVGTRVVSVSGWIRKGAVAGCGAM